ncbi:MAG: hypothetical protein WBO45_16650 [Planctomycetota bacterium]
MRASDADIKTGLLGFISVEHGPWIFDGICLRRTSDGRFVLSFPARTDRAGRKHAFVRPADDETRKSIERKILGQLGQRPDLVEQREAHDG